MSGKEVLKMVATCVPVRGHQRSSICDLQRNAVKLIPHELYDVIINHEGKTIEEIKLNYEQQYHDIVDEYLNFLFDNEYAFLTDTPEFFPPLNTQWHEPFEITNAIIDIDQHSTYDLEPILEQLDELNCKHLQIRFFDRIETDRIINILEFLNSNKSIISSVNVVVKYSALFSIPQVKALFELQPRLSSLLVYDSESNTIIHPIEGDILLYVSYITKNIHSCADCGVISHEYFAPNIQAYTEGLQHNSCLNRKISVDAQGNIKNCPSMQERYGNIKDITLQEALHHNDFKKYGNITKDEINICKDCEFRYVCTDCRAYVENPKDMYSKPLKCGYDPYTNVWEQWSTNPLKQKAIEYYELKGLV